MTYACALIAKILTHVLFRIQKPSLLSQQLLSQRLGRTQNFHLISPGKTAHHQVLTDAAGVTVVMRERTPLDTGLTSPTDTGLPGWHQPWCRWQGGDTCCHAHGRGGDTVNFQCPE